VRPIREAHALGMKVFIKPHLAYWGSPFKWRGEITFDQDVAWNRFFTSYTKWILAIAKACQNADGFCVGTELDRTIAKERKWREIIAGVREVTKAPLTYAANWTDYTEIGFWDALDIIGIQAYFPLTDKKGATLKELRTGWKTTMADLRRFASRHRRNIVFTELGYNTSFDTAIRPWESRSDGARAAPFQRSCMSIALAAISSEPRVEGAFLWKWFPPPSPIGRNFPLATPEMKATIRAAWKNSSTAASKKPAKTGKR
jgi:Glycoside Hydrolase Family 113